MCQNLRLFFFQAEDGIRDLVRSRGLGDVYKRQTINPSHLYELLNGGYLVKKGHDKRGIEALNFKTIYGEKSIKFDYLFINANPFKEAQPTESQKEAAKVEIVTERDIEIDLFLHKVVAAVIYLANIGLGIKEIVKAKEIAETIWTEYKTRFEDRIDLSEYTCRSGALDACLLYTSPSPRDRTRSRMPSSA